MEQEAKILVSHKGNLDYALLNALLLDLKTKLSNENIDKLIAKRVYNIAVECFENLFRHANDLKEDVAFEVAMIGSKIVVRTKNKVQKTVSIELNELLQSMAGMSVENLKTVYREKIKSTSYKNPSGAGVGLLDVAIRSSNNIEYQFEKHESDVEIFHFVVEVKK